ncbi:MAG TPA: methyltransferase domain-containing protein [Candidatus Eisenbacteria bacterium]|nr:methyltransferase domain-containing protein [Candidatus Eisenbacteria bacterium]
MSTGPAPYVHGTHPDEQRRLSDLNTLVNRLSLEALAPQRGERLLDLGSGLGQFTRDVARASGVPALGVERSLAQIARARALAAAAGEERLAEFREGDAQSPPLAEGEWGAFDVAHARFLLEHVPDPLAVVRAMARAVKPGGRVVLEDDDHPGFRLWPEPPGVMAVWSAYQRTYDRLGCDPIVGRRLVELLAAAGLAPRRITMLPFGACAGDPAFPAYVRNLGDIFAGAREAILATGGVGEAAFDDAQITLRAFAKRPDGALWYTISWAEGVRR